MGNQPSEIRTYLYIVKQTNVNLPLVPFLHVIKDVVVDGHYCGLGAISQYKEKTIFLEVLNILTGQSFFCQLDASNLITKEDKQSLGINVAEISYIPVVPAIRILSTKNVLFKEGDQILGFENKNNTDLLELLEEGGENRKIVVLRDNEVFTVETTTMYLDCEIGTGILYKVEKQEDIFIKGYNGNITKQYDENEDEYVKLEPKEEDNEVKQDNYDNTEPNTEKFKHDNKNNNEDNQFLNDNCDEHRDYNNHNTYINIDEVVTNKNVSKTLDKFIEEEQKYLMGENKIEDAAVIVNDQFVCAEDYEEPGVMKEDAFNVRREMKESSMKNMEDGNNCVFSNLTNENMIEEDQHKQNIIRIFEDNDSDEPFVFERKEDAHTGKSQKDCIHFSDCDCEEKKKKDEEKNEEDTNNIEHKQKKGKNEIDFISDSDENNKKWLP